MNSAKIEAKTNIKFIVKLGCNNIEVIDDLGRVYGKMTQRNLHFVAKLPTFDEKHEQEHCRGGTGVSDEAFPSVFCC